MKINKALINHMAKQRFNSEYRANIRNKNKKKKLLNKKNWILIIFYYFWVKTPKKKHYLTPITNIFCNQFPGNWFRDFPLIMNHYSWTINPESCSELARVEWSGTTKNHEPFTIHWNNQHPVSDPLRQTPKISPNLYKFLRKSPTFSENAS